VSTTYLIKIYVIYYTPTTADFKFNLIKTGTAVTSSALTYRYIAPGDLSWSTDTAATLPIGDVTIPGAGTGRGILEIEGRLVYAAGTAGVLSFQWAQGTSNASPTVVMPGSHIFYQECYIS
jgi:hypothetical protein